MALGISAADPRLLIGAIVQIRAAMDAIGGFTDVEDSRPLPESNGNCASIAKKLRNMAQTSL